jgi:hypothetical protein
MIPNIFSTCEFNLEAKILDKTLYAKGKVVPLGFN